MLASSLKEIAVDMPELTVSFMNDSQLLNIVRPELTMIRDITSKRHVKKAREKSTQT